MNMIVDGGFAFPVCNEANVNGDAGMTLRDYFAGQAAVNDIEFADMRSAAEWIGVEAPDEDNYIECLEFTFKLEAFIKYKKADAMLEARK
jgi:hypothetical protein